MWTKYWWRLKFSSGGYISGGYVNKNLEENILNLDLCVLFVCYPSKTCSVLKNIIFAVEVQL